MVNLKPCTEIVKFLAFITWVIITEYMVSGMPKSLNTSFKTSRTNFVLSPHNCLTTGNLENKSTTTIYVKS